MSSSIALAVKSVSKRFGPVIALDDVSFQVPSGSVCAVIGENGAGKSTLMKLLSGVHAPDAGEILLDGKPFSPRSPLHARRNGVAMIYQELNLAPDLSVEENLLLGLEPRSFGWIRKKILSQMAREALDRLQHGHLDLNTKAHQLSIAEQQIVEIARALIWQPRLLLLDEPTSSLTHQDVENLFRVIRELRKRGVTILYISHFLEECRQVASTYLVMRDGRAASSGELAGVTNAEIIESMVGRDIAQLYPRTPHSLGEPILELRDFSGATRPRGINLALRRGEILGIAGLVGAGRTETVRAAFGLDPIRAGRVNVGGRNSTRTSPHRRWKEGVGMLSEDRKAEGLMLGRSLAENLCLTHLNKQSRCGVVSNRRLASTSEQWLRKLQVRFRHVHQPVDELSGGNQQKIAIARLLYHDCDILLLDEPTRGIDLGSKAEIYKLIDEAARQGKAVLIISSYLPELLGICDTIAVMRRGELIATRPASEWTHPGLMAAAVGAEEP